MQISEIQQQARELRAAQGWSDRSPEVRLAYLVTEIGEVAREVLRLERAENESSAAITREALGMEIYDAVWNLCDLANILDVDLDQAFEKKVLVNRRRAW